MLVRELIKLLEELPPDMKIRIGSPVGYDDIKEVTITRTSYSADDPGIGWAEIQGADQ